MRDQIATYADRPEYDSFTSKGLTQQVEAALAEFIAAIDAIAKSDEPRTVETVYVPLNDAYRQLGVVTGPADLFAYAHPDPDVKKAAEAIASKIKGARASVAQHPGLYAAASAVDVSNASPAVQKMHEKLQLEFRLMGADQPEDVRDRIKEIVKRKAELEVAYEAESAENILTVAIKDETELDGLPEDVIKEFCQPNTEGVIELPIVPPAYFPGRQYGTTADLRRRLVTAWENRGYPGNEPRLREQLVLSREHAGLLGFPTMAHAQLLRNMAGNPETVLNFISGMVEATEAPLTRDVAQMLAMKRNDDLAAEGLEEWDMAFYEEQVRKNDYDLDSKLLRQYFTYPDMLQACLDMAGAMGLTFAEATDVPVWHEDVTCYEVFDDGVLRGRFFFDMFTRDNKFQHFACSTMIPPVTGVQLAEGALVCNFTKGDGSLGSQLLDFDSAKTLLHEFGHGVQLFKAMQPIVGQAGTYSDPDFGEAPSMMLENWMTDAAFLKRYARHYETREPIPTDLVEKVVLAENFGKAFFVRRQLMLAGLALQLYLEDPETLDFVKLFDNAYETSMPFSRIADTAMWCSWGHLMNDGYGPGYYKYMWSLAWSKVLLKAFDTSNLMEPEALRAYADEILAPGGSISSREAVRNLLGDPTIDAQDAAKAFADSFGEMSVPKLA